MVNDFNELRNENSRELLLPSPRGQTRASALNKQNRYFIVWTHEGSVLIYLLRDYYGQLFNAIFTRFMKNRLSHTSRKSGEHELHEHRLGVEYSSTSTYNYRWCLSTLITFVDEIELKKTENRIPTKIMYYSKQQTYDYMFGVHLYIYIRYIRYTCVIGISSPCFRYYSFICALRHKTIYVFMYKVFLYSSATCGG